MFLHFGQGLAGRSISNRKYRQILNEPTRNRPHYPKNKKSQDNIIGTSENPKLIYKYLTEVKGIDNHSASDLVAEMIISPS